MPRPPAPPKQRDSERTRARILAAAQACFAASGYSHVGLREIAARAEIDVSMVARYFGSKEKLFRAAFSAVVVTDALPHRPREDFGRNIVEMFATSDEHTITPLYMLVRAATDPNVAETIRELATTQMVVPLSAWLGGADAELRAAQILALCAGFFTYRVLVPLAPFSGTLTPEVRSWLERSIQDIVDRK